MAGVPDLAHHQHVEGDPQASRDRRRDLDPAAGQAQHDNVRRGTEARAEYLGEALPGGSAVANRVTSTGTRSRRCLPTRQPGASPIPVSPVTPASPTSG